MAINLKIISFGVVASFIFGVSAHAEYPIAGVTPDQRPEGAPEITSIDKNPDWYEGALRGVSKPYPNSLKFLENQGNWYTPFTRPGMPGPYDIRGLHSGG